MSEIDLDELVQERNPLLVKLTYHVMERVIERTRGLDLLLGQYVVYRNNNAYLEMPLVRENISHDSEGKADIHIYWPPFGRFVIGRRKGRKNRGKKRTEWGNLITYMPHSNKDTRQQDWALTNNLVDRLTDEQLVIGLWFRKHCCEKRLEKLLKTTDIASLTNHPVLTRKRQMLEEESALDEL